MRCLASVGKEYVYYFPKGKGGRTCINDAEGVFSERWVNVRSGEVKQMPDRTLAVPASQVGLINLECPFNGAPCLVHLKRRA